LATRSSNSQLGVQGVPGVDGSESLMLELCLPDAGSNRRSNLVVLKVVHT
jgi:hypothetical protein